MSSTLRNEASLLSGIGLVGVANALLSTVISMRMAVEGFSTFSISAVLAGYNVGFTVGAWSIARLVGRVGHIRAFSAFSAVTGAAAVLLPLLLHAAAWLPLRCVAGFAMAGMYMVVESWLNARADISTRGTLLAIYMLILQLAMGAGQLSVAAFSPHDVEPFLVVTALYALAVVPIALTRTEQPPIPTIADPSVRQFARIAPLALVGSVIGGVVSTVLLTLGPLYVLAHGRGTHDVGLFMAAAISSGLFLQWPVGRLSDRIGRRVPLFAVCTLLSILSGVIAWWEPASLGLLLTFAGLAGALVYLIYPLSLAYINDLVSVEESTAAGGTMLLCFGVGAMVGPFVGAFAMDVFGARGMFVWIAATSSLLALAALYRVFTRTTVPASEREHFVPVSLPRTAPTGQLDPRVDE